jgi:polyferredoxin
MEDQELREKLNALEAKVDAAYHAAEKTRKYLLWTGIVTLALFILPAIGLAFAIPQFISTYSAIGNIDVSHLQ